MELGGRLAAMVRSASRSTGLVAFGDEWFNSPRAMPSVYMFGAALARPEDVPGIRENALSLRAPGQRKAPSRHTGQGRSSGLLVWNTSWN